MNNSIMEMGEKIFGALTFPGFALAEATDKGPGSLPLGIILSFLGAPITLPCALIFSPIYGFFVSKVHDMEK